MKYRHAAVWIDSREAHVFRLEAGAFVENVVRRPEHVAHSDVRLEEFLFFGEVANLLHGEEGLFLAGPAYEKDRFRRYILRPTSESPLQADRVALVSSPCSMEFERTVRDYLTIDCQTVVLDPKDVRFELPALDSLADKATCADAAFDESPNYRCG